MSWRQKPRLRPSRGDLVCVVPRQPSTGWRAGWGNSCPGAASSACAVLVHGLCEQLGVAASSGPCGISDSQAKNKCFLPKNLSSPLSRASVSRVSPLHGRLSLLRPASPRCLEGRGASGNYLQRFVGPSRAKGAGGCPSRPPHPPGRLWGRPGVAPVCVIAGLPGNLS